MKVEEITAIEKLVQEAKKEFFLGMVFLAFASVIIGAVVVSVTQAKCMDGIAACGFVVVGLLGLAAAVVGLAFMLGKTNFVSEDR